MHAPITVHLEALYQIVWYLNRHPDKCLLRGRQGNLRVEVFTNVEWVGSVADWRSTSCYWIFVGGNLVTWRSKYSMMARSSSEGEFWSMAHSICELLWIQGLLRELVFVFPKPMRLYCDNKTVINIAHNPVQHDRTKHIEVDKHFIKDKLHIEHLCILFVKTGLTAWFVY